MEGIAVGVLHEAALHAKGGEAVGERFGVEGVEPGMELNVAGSGEGDGAREAGLQGFVFGEVVGQGGELFKEGLDAVAGEGVERGFTEARGNG